MTRAFTESDADHLVMVFDDEELLPGAIGAMLDRAADDPTAAFVAGRFLYRDADGRMMRRPGAGSGSACRPVTNSSAWRTAAAHGRGSAA